MNDYTFPLADSDTERDATFLHESESYSYEELSLFYMGNGSSHGFSDETDLLDGYHTHQQQYLSPVYYPQHLMQISPKSEK